MNNLQKGFISIFVLGIITVIAGSIALITVAGLFYSQVRGVKFAIQNPQDTTSKERNIVVEVSSTPAPTYTPTAIPTPFLKAGWIVHTLDALNLKYQLPDNSWKVQSPPSNMMCDLLLTPNNSNQHICIFKLANPSLLSPEEFLCKVYLNFKDQDSESTLDGCLSKNEVIVKNVGNLEGLKIAFSEGSKLAGNYYVLSKDKSIIIISDKNKINDSLWQNLRDQVISTFWFE